MIVEILLSKNELIGSRIISSTTHTLYPELDKELVPSHLAILYDGFVYESTLFTGVRTIPFEVWIQHNTILHRETHDLVEVKFSKVITSIWGKKYDWPGVTYYSIRLLMYILFKIPIPKENKWAKRSRYFCVEVLGKLKGKDYSMKVPVDFYVKGF